MNRYIAPYFATRARRITAIVIVANFAFFAALLGVMFYQRSAARIGQSLSIFRLF